ncbi:MrcB family domain-containing protein [Aliicoccus persicus]|uniref:5-methylcytosine-specific restriction enzyme A n=1 Tax=Aliicoccus persicus TaxID=930138 RepID=A0A662Z2P6_9STAP|nr:DUF3578 domain-containing protein [Aliicoccus persicus]SEV93306.1 5-methylcytosine-specific restriction enzyme A [Aliicoccus persicus]
MSNELRNSFNQVLETYFHERNLNSSQSGHPLSQLSLIRNEIMPKMSSQFNEKYHVKGSIGTPKEWAWIPWLKIGLRNKIIHVNAHHGFHIMYIFREDMSGFYLSLMQGWNYFKEEYNVETAHIRVRELAAKIRPMIVSEDDGEFAANMDLKTDGNYGSGYESSYIFGKFYEAGKVPSDEILFNDLDKMLQLYDRLAGLIGNRTFQEFNRELLLNDDLLYGEENTEEQDYQTKANETVSEVLVEEHVTSPKVKKATVRSSDLKEYYPRDANQAGIAIELAGNKCEYDDSLPSFKRNTTGKTYVEAHHLIPVSKYRAFDYDIDVPENIVALNPMIHRQIHLGKDDDKQQIIEKLFEVRKEKLREAGIGITLEQLLEMYGITH